MAKRNLLLSFDAFGTLFSPRAPVAIQYAHVARQCGLSVQDADVEAHLFAAIKRQRKAHPNYGRSTGLGATKWWTDVSAPTTHEPFSIMQARPLTKDEQIINSTFTPLLPPGETLLPSALAPALLRRFACSEGYAAEPDLVHTIRSLRQASGYDRVVVGVVTNSDDRVPDVLSSLGLTVSPLRYGSDASPAQLVKGRDYDVDFHCLSYDVGAEKPDRRMFDAAEEMLRRVAPEEDALSWQKVHIGDEHAKDVAGALSVGWDAVLLDVDGASNDVPSLGDAGAASLQDVFKRGHVVRVASLRGFAARLCNKD